AKCIFAPFLWGKNKVYIARCFIFAIRIQIIVNSHHSKSLFYEKNLLHILLYGFLALCCAPHAAGGFGAGKVAGKL
ncbi:MAG: hypothetical protein MR446_07500, partial [Bacteroidales bacterium]|nr:hypothetical protein [Bacteroidales bacterium]